MSVNLVFWIATNILGQPAILIGLIVLLGLVLQKKTLSQTMTGTFKAVIGFMIINGGAGIIVNALNVFQPMWKEVFGLEAQEWDSLWANRYSANNLALLLPLPW